MRDDIHVHVLTGGTAPVVVQPNTHHVADTVHGVKEH